MCVAARSIKTLGAETVFADDKTLAFLWREMGSHKKAQKHKRRSALLLTTED